MAFEYKLTRSVEFSDTDMAGIMHFSNFFRFMEATEHAFCRSLGIEVHPGSGAGKVGWPRVHASCDYKHPLRFEDTVEIHLLVREIRSKSLAYTFIFRSHRDGLPIEVARGSLVAVAVGMDPLKQTMKAVVIPQQIRAMLEVAPPEYFHPKTTAP
ncbi:MAG: thioesterase family protein [Verrucomicrobiota bacterium]